jgi:hypothetical protein
VGVSLGLWGLGLVVDLTFEESWSRWHHLFEDGFKFLGIAAWMAYSVITSLEFVAADDTGGPAPDRV